MTEVSAIHLTAVACNWELLYEEIIKQFLQGKGNTIDNYWLGIDKNVIGLTAYSEEITPDIEAEIEEAKNEMLNGKDVFYGEIYDNSGNIRCEVGETIRDEILLEQFNWFVEGVEIYDK